MNLSHRISLFAVLVAGTMVVVFSGVAYKTSYDNIVDGARQTILKDSALLTVRAEARIGTIAKMLDNLSENAVLFNALVDSAGRDTYLLPFLQGFSQLDGIPIRISLRDFQGRTIAETAPTLETDGEKTWFKKAIAGERSSATVMTLNGARTLLATRMLTYPRTRTVEGALLFVLPFDSLTAADLESQFPGYQARLGIASPENEKMSGVVVERGEDFVIYQSLVMPEALADVHLMTELRQDTSQMYDAQRGQILIYSASGFLLIVIVILASLWFSRRLTRPLTELEQVAAAIIENGNFDTRLSVTGSDEINRLRGTFNELLDYIGAAHANLDATASGLRGVVQAIPDRMVVLNADGQPQTNSPLAQLIRSSRQGVDDETQNESSLPLQAQIRQNIRNIRDGKQSEIIEFSDDSGVNGERKWFESRMALLSDENNENSSILLLIHETTAEKQSEERLTQAQKMEAIGQLTGGIAHDFNNLLMIVVGNLELTQNLSNGPEDVTKRNTRILNAMSAAQRGAALTARLLAFARRQSLVPEVVDVSTLVDGMQTLMHRTLGENIEVDLSLHPAVWPCRVDPSQLENAIINLAINARDASPEGGRLVFATGNEVLEQDGHVDSGEYVTVTVTDNGSGMSPEVQDRVFEPFFTTKETGKGSGLGLSMVYGFAKQSRGSVVVSSKIGEGTSVKLYFPRETAEIASNSTPEPDGNVEAAAGETVLVVEDNQEILELAMQIMEMSGYRPIAAENANIALEILKHKPEITAMFSDVVLPGGMSGFQLVTKALDLRPDLKVLMASGFSDTEELPQEIRERNIEVLSKPYRRDDVARAMATILNSG